MGLVLLTLSDLGLPQDCPAPVVEHVFKELRDGVSVEALTPFLSFPRFSLPNSRGSHSAKNTQKEKGDSGRATGYLEIPLSALRLSSLKIANGRAKGNFAIIEQRGAPVSRTPEALQRRRSAKEGRSDTNIPNQEEVYAQY